MVETASACMVPIEVEGLWSSGTKARPLGGTCSIQMRLPKQASPDATSWLSHYPPFVEFHVTPLNVARRLLKNIESGVEAGRFSVKRLQVPVLVCLAHSNFTPVPAGLRGKGNSMQKLRAVHRVAMLSVGLVILYFCCTGSRLQLIDIRTMVGHLPATNPNWMAIREESLRLSLLYLVGSGMPMYHEHREGRRAPEKQNMSAAMA